VEQEMANSLSTGSYSLEITIAATPARVWQALTAESPAWWPKDFHTSARALRFVIEPFLGGRAYEDFGGGDGLVWYSVVGLEVGWELVLAGHLLPPFGGPAVTGLRLTLSTQGSSTLLRVQDDRFGALGGDSPVEGWQFVFDTGLRQYVESVG
jgi:uncharacterized protein YndB with AHSA1/START domain